MFVFNVSELAHDVIFIIICWTLGMSITLELGMNAEAGVFTSVILFIFTRGTAGSRDIAGVSTEMRIFKFCPNIGEILWCPG